MTYSDPFLQSDDISEAEVLELIANYQFIEPIYHSDGFGHLQVETPFQANPHSISRLIHFIELKQLWPDCIKLLSSKSECWLLDFSVELQKEKSAGVLNCFVKITDFLEASGNQVNHLQNVAQWPWHSDSNALLEDVKNRLIILERSLLKEDGLTSEIDLSIVRHSLAALEQIKIFQKV